MGKKEYKCLLISDFNLSNFAGYLTNDPDYPKVQATAAPYGQVAPILMETNAEWWGKNLDFAIIWTQPETTIESFNHIINYQSVDTMKILEEVDKYCSALMNIRGRINFAFIPTWVFPSLHRGFGMLDMKNGLGTANTLMRINLRLSENLDKALEIDPNFDRGVEFRKYLEGVN